MKYTLYECDKICSAVDEFFQGSEIVNQARLNVSEGTARGLIWNARAVCGTNSVARSFANYCRERASADVFILLLTA